MKDAEAEMKDVESFLHSVLVKIHYPEGTSVYISRRVTHSSIQLLKLKLFQRLPDICLLCTHCPSAYTPLVCWHIWKGSGYTYTAASRSSSNDMKDVRPRSSRVFRFLRNFPFRDEEQTHQKKMKNVLFNRKWEKENNTVKETWRRGTENYEFDDFAEHKLKYKYNIGKMLWKLSSCFPWDEWNL